MCYSKGIGKQFNQLEERYSATFLDSSAYEPMPVISGFTYPAWPILTEASPKQFTLAHWGLIPSWGKADIGAFRKKTNTLNAMIETVHEKPTYKGFVNQRCLIPVDRFYEWQHVGKDKIRHIITAPNEGIFSMAGIYSRIDGQEYYTILTTDANPLMAEIHNTKKRMPVILTPDEESLWLEGDDIAHYMDRNNIELMAIPA